MAEGPATSSDSQIGSCSLDDDPDIRILLLGRQGAGKSSSGNTLFGQKRFKVPKRKEKHKAVLCEETMSIGERQVHVIDTPDLMDPDLSEEKLESEKEKLVSLCKAGLSAVLLVTPIDTSVENEEEIVDFIKCLLGTEILNYLLVLFTYGDELDDDQTIDEHLQDHADLQRLVRECGGKFHCFNNKCKVDGQVTELLQKIERMVTENSGKFVMQQRKRRNSKVDPINFSEQNPADEGSLFPEKLRLVLLGKTGVGKSAIGNTIIGRNVFPSFPSSNSQTKNGILKTTKRFGKEISVIDTPGLYDNELSQKEIISEIIKCSIWAAPGPHVFLIVMKVGRFTEEEFNTVKLLKDVFGKDFEKYVMILFTHKDQLKNKTPEEFLKDSDKKLQSFVKSCGSRSFFLDNTSSSYLQVKDLLSEIEMMLKQNGGTFFTSNVFREIEKHICEVMKEKSTNSLMPDPTNWQKLFCSLAEDLQFDVLNQIIAGILNALTGSLKGLSMSIEKLMEKNMCVIQ